MLKLILAIFLVIGIVSAQVAVPVEIGNFKTVAHGLRSTKVTLLDSQTIFIQGFKYDGAGPDAYFWVGRGAKPHIGGIKIPNEKNSYGVLEGYAGDDITLRLPGQLTFNDIDWLSVYCVAYKENFGHISIPKGLNLPEALILVQQ